MATHNRLGRLGPDEYLEIIAPDPTAPPPDRPRWFGLDTAGPPRLGAWIVRVPDLETAIAAAPWSAGEPVAMTRGDLGWRIAVRPDGALPWGGAAPLLIEWPPGPHPASQMARTGHRLDRLAVALPDCRPLTDWTEHHLADPRIVVTEAPVPALVARFQGPSGATMLDLTTPVWTISAPRAVTPRKTARTPGPDVRRHRAATDPPDGALA
jgi:hypothetical protein